MFELSLPIVAAWANAAIFGVAGMINVIAIRSVREVYADWDIPVGFYRTLGLIEVAAAVFLATPEFRFWGVILAAPILFGSVIMLLDHRHYIFATSVVVMFVALGAAILAIPPPHHYSSYVIEASND